MEYQTNRCQIFCQLMIRDGEARYGTEVYCVTHIITNVRV